ncbi:MAG: hypothetical protein V4489_10310 [Chlamydiota bacterium]
MTPALNRNSSLSIQLEDKSTFHDRALFYKAFEMQRFIHSLPPKHPKYQLNHNECMQAVHGRNSSEPLIMLTTGLKDKYQTKQGLVLEGVRKNDGKIAKAIHTPYGTIYLGSSPALQDLAKPLGLEKMRQDQIHPEWWEGFGTFIHITRWEGRTIEYSAYRKKDDYISPEETIRVYHDMKSMTQPQIPQEENKEAEQSCKRIFSWNKPFPTILRNRELYGKVNFNKIL